MEESYRIWRKEAEGCPKLEVLGRLMNCECKKRRVDVGCKRQRSMLVRLRDGMAELQNWQVVWVR